jgi:hypothetical protein
MERKQMRGQVYQKTDDTRDPKERFKLRNQEGAEKMKTTPEESRSQLIQNVKKREGGTVHIYRTKPNVAWLKFQQTPTAFI